MRHRGPYEYDKFILNIMQLCNEAKTMQSEFKTSCGDLQMKKNKIIAFTDKLAAEDGVLQEILIMQYLAE